MARSVDDCHTRFAPDYAQETGVLGRSEQYGGIGATIIEAQSIDPAAPGPVIVWLVENGPAMRAGLRIGDAVIAVDGMPASGVASSRLAERVRGTPGTNVRLRVERPGEAAPLEFAVGRELVQLPLVEARTLGQPDGITVGYVRVRSFVGPSVAEVRGALERLRAAGAGQWVLDLRDNSGGDLDTFRRIASNLIPQGTLAVTTDRSGKAARLPVDGRAFVPFVQPLAVLVDGHSASAAELLAADLQDYGLARLFGTATAGCFGTSQPFPLPDGSALWLTVSTLKSGLAERDVHKVGVVPDEVVARSRSDLVAGQDPQLARAVAWLRCPTCAPDVEAAGVVAADALGATP
jgi:carboxyl-terminal processing protease